MPESRGERILMVAVFIVVVVLVVCTLNAIFTDVHEDVYAEPTVEDRVEALEFRLTFEDKFKRMTSYDPLDEYESLGRWLRSDIPGARAIDGDGNHVDCSQSEVCSMVSTARHYNEISFVGVNSDLVGRVRVRRTKLWLKLNGADEDPWPEPEMDRHGTWEYHGDNNIVRSDGGFITHCPNPDDCVINDNVGGD